MPFDNKEYQRLYRLKNKNKMKEYRLKNKKKKKEYLFKNKEKIKEQSRLYRQKNKEKIKAYKKQYYQTEAGKKGRRICHWKRYGIKDHYNDNYETIYKIYSIQKMCSICFKLFNEKNKMDYKCLDHCHNTGKLRRICCGYCNINVVK